MRILALDHGTRRIGVAVSDETKTIAQPLEFILAEPFAIFLDRLKKPAEPSEASETGPRQGAPTAANEPAEPSAPAAPGEEKGDDDNLPF